MCVLKNKEKLNLATSFLHSSIWPISERDNKPIVRFHKSINSYTFTYRRKKIFMKLLFDIYNRAYKSYCAIKI